MKVAMVSSAFGMNGGPETVCLNLTQGLLDLGVEVTLFAPADWTLPYHFLPSLEQSLWAIPNFSNAPRYFRNNLKAASQLAVLPHAKDFDIIHLHSAEYAYAIAKHVSTPCVLTLHSIIQEMELSLFKKGGLHTVAVSESQKSHFDVDTVIWNGVPVKNIECSLSAGSSLLFAGRLSEQKGVETAIKIAEQSGKELLIFGRTGTSAERQKNFQLNIAPRLTGRIRYMGEIDQETLFKYMRKASALLFAIREPETFGLVAAEALACGTPVIGTLTSPLPEILTNDQVSFLSNDIGELAEAAKHTERFDRKACREYAEKNFDSSIMAKKYISLYKKILKGTKASPEM